MYLETINTVIADELISGISTMNSSYKTLEDGTEKLAEAIAALDEMIADIPDMLFKDRSNEYLRSCIHSDEAISSFVFEKNAVTSALCHYADG